MQTLASPSGWETYYVVFLSAAVALGIPLILSVVSLVFGKRARESQSVDPVREIWDPSQTTAQIPDLPAPSEPIEATLGRRINTRFFLSANAALILIALALVLVPYASVLHAPASGAGMPLLLRGLISVVSLALFAGLGLLYSARKGDLNWLQTFRGQAETSEREERG